MNFAMSILLLTQQIWHHVGSKLWLFGQDFIQKPVDQWETWEYGPLSITEQQEVAAEVQKKKNIAFDVSLHVNTNQKSKSVDDALKKGIIRIDTIHPYGLRASRFSSFLKLVRITGYVKLHLRKLKESVTRNKTKKALSAVRGPEAESATPGVLDADVKDTNPQSPTCMPIPAAIDMRNAMDSWVRLIQLQASQVFTLHSKLARYILALKCSVTTTISPFLALHPYEKEGLIEP